MTNYTATSETNSNIHIFYHVYQTEDWETLYQHQMHSLFLSKLYDSAKSLTIGVIGNKPLPHIPKNADVSYFSTNREEANTLNMLKAFAEKTENNSQILYFHTKGITHKGKTKLACYSWRLMMEYFMIHQWKQNIELLKTYDAVGTNWTIDTFMGKKPHFSGNFWWANSSYINSLDHSYLDTNCRYDREFWIGSNFYTNNPKIKDIHNSHMNDINAARHMFELYAESNYMNTKE